MKEKRLKTGKRSRKMRSMIITFQSVLDWISLVFFFFNQLFI